MRLAVLLAVVLLIALLAVPGLCCVDYPNYLHWVSTLPTGANAVRSAGYGTHVLVALERSLLVTLPDAEGNLSVLAELGCTSLVNDVCTYGTAAYLAEPGLGLQVVDLSSPTAPELVATIPVAGATQRVSALGGYLYLSAGDSGLVVFSLSDPFAPVPVNTLDTPGHARGLFAADGLLLVADDLWGLRIYGLADPTNPTLLAVADTDGALTDLFLLDNLVLAADRMFGLQIVDIASPQQPVIRGRTAAGDGWSVVGLPGTAILSDRGEGVCFYEIGDPDHLTLSGHLQAADEFAGLLLHDDFLLACGMQGVRVAPQRPTVAAPPLSAVTGGAHELFATASRLYGVVSAGGQGVFRIWDVSTAGDLAFRGSTLLNNYPVLSSDLVVRGDWAYIARGVVQVVDVSNPTTPHVQATVSTGGAVAIALDGTRVLVGADSLAQLWVGELTTPSSLEPRSTVPIGGVIKSVAVKEGTGYVLCDAPPRILCYDLAELAVPQLRGVLALPDAPQELLIAGGLAYLSLANEGLRVLDRSNPFQPSVIGELRSLSPLSKLVSLGSTLAVVESSLCVWLVDVSQPTLPRFCGRLEGGVVGAVAAAPQLLFLGDRRMGIGDVSCFDAPCAALTTVPTIDPPLGIPLQAYPNPANPVVTLAFALATGAHCELTVYDCRGRLLRRLLSRNLAAGEHKFEWNGLDDRGRPVPSGQYFVRLVSAGLTGSTKLGLVR